MYALRNSIFKTKETMQEYCMRQTDENAPHRVTDTLSVSLFKVAAKQYDYYVKCLNYTDSDSHFYVYCCKKDRQRTKPSKTKEQNQPKVPAHNYGAR
jgi:hypothetical protein